MMMAVHDHCRFRLAPRVCGLFTAARNHHDRTHLYSVSLLCSSRPGAATIWLHVIHLDVAAAPPLKALVGTLIS
jgi:hypothetical protein